MTELVMPPLLLRLGPRMLFEGQIQVQPFYLAEKIFAVRAETAKHSPAGRAGQGRTYRNTLQQLCSGMG